MIRKIDTMKTVLILLVSSTLFSCIGESSSDCEWEKENYREKWDYIVAKTYKSPNYKATYVIETTSGKKIYFQPIQDIVASVEPGDRILKPPYYKYAFWVNSYHDTLRSRIFSVSCDSLVKITFPHR